MAKKIGWGVLGAGSIAAAFADGVARSRTGVLAAVGSRDQGKAQAFADQWGVQKAYGSYQEVLADPDVDGVYVALPHTLHPLWAIRAAEAGKHLLVEKPMAINAYLAETIVEAAVKNDVFLMEAYMYRCHPQTMRLVELIKSGVIGEVSTIQASFSFHAGFDASSRLWSNELAGGGILDVGGYTTSIAGLIAGAALGVAFAEPLSIVGQGNLHPETGVDAWAVAVAKYEGGIVATLTTGVGVAQEYAVRVFGSKGRIELANPFVCNRSGTEHSQIVLDIRGEGCREIAVESDVTSYVHEVDACGEAILAGGRQAAFPAMSPEDSLANLRTQDRWRAAIGLEYRSEKPEALNKLTPAGRSLVRAGAPAGAGTVLGLDKPLSRLVMGVDNQTTAPHVEAVFDDYFERGGNAFDTAFVYGERSSRLLGSWVRARGVRDETVVIIKGAHTPLCDPDSLRSQVDEQLEWLGFDADIYMMHRDNPDIPVGEFVDAMNECVAEGKFKAFGGSNWSLERVQAANEYARDKNVQGFSVVSNNLSLAEMVNPVWGGCLHARDAAFRLYLQESGVALLPWSSQARGFFVPERSHPDLRADASLVHSWYSADNFKRQARAIELAREKGCSPVAIALAWVLHQPFAVFPLIGPRHLAETRSSFRALEVRLSDAESRYLNLED